MSATTVDTKTQMGLLLQTREVIARNAAKGWHYVQAAANKLGLGKAAGFIGRLFSRVAGFLAKPLSWLVGIGQTTLNHFGLPLLAVATLSTEGGQRATGKALLFAARTIAWPLTKVAKGAGWVLDRLGRPGALVKKTVRLAADYVLIGAVKTSSYAMPTLARVFNPSSKVMKTVAFLSKYAIVVRFFQLAWMPYSIAFVGIYIATFYAIYRGLYALRQHQIANGEGLEFDTLVAPKAEPKPNLKVAAAEPHTYVNGKPNMGLGEIREFIKGMTQLDIAHAIMAGDIPGHPQVMTRSFAAKMVKKEKAAEAAKAAKASLKADAEAIAAEMAKGDQA